jgi:pimeloyl-ACP methyl ester carboxylesterase
MPTPKLSRLLQDTGRQLLKLDGYSSRYAKTAIGRLHYYEAPGSGRLPPMVFLHGLSAHAAELAPVFRRLRRYCQRIIAVDLPVHGFSDVPSTGIFDETMSDLFYRGMDQILAPLPPVLIFGNSLGGLGAIRYTNRNPERVRLLVLSSPGGAGITGEQLRDLGEIFAHHTQFKPSSFVERLYNKPPLYRWIIEQEVRQRFSRPELRELLKQFHTDHLLQPDELQAIQQPTLLIWGKQDRVLENHLDFFKAHMPGHVKLHEPDHFTHCPYMETPQELAHKILHFALLHCPEATCARA